MTTHTISASPLSIADIDKVIRSKAQLELSSEVCQKVSECRTYLDKKLATSQDPIYGVTTGFGSLYKEHISANELVTLQENIIKSHACGVGETIPSNLVSLILLLKIQSLGYGHSGIHLDTLKRMVDMYNHAVLPVIYEYGSLGASGDLAPLAHLSLPLLGLGEVFYKNEVITGEKALELLEWPPLTLHPKEGLALLNGTQFMSAYGVHNVIHARRLLRLANIIAALSLEAYDGRIEPFLSLVHEIRPQPGQQLIAADILEIVKDSEIMSQPKKHVQDPYSFRCVPQVHGASLDAINYVESVITNEINSVTDNPNIFPDEDKIISAGNFHGQPLALASDFLAIALSELGSISERRTFQLISGARDLPSYLVAEPGINSGLMIPQYTAASLVSANKSLCHPDSVDSIVSSNGQEDHVSMGANAATKTFRIINNVYQILAIELLTATQALDLRQPLKTSPFLENLVSNFRAKVTFINNDRVLYHDLSNSVEFLKEMTLE